MSAPETDVGFTLTLGDWYSFNTDGFEIAVFFKCDRLRLNKHDSKGITFFLHSFCDVAQVFNVVAGASKRKRKRSFFSNVGTRLTCLSKFVLNLCCSKNNAVTAFVRITRLRLILCFVLI